MRSAEVAPSAAILKLGAMPTPKTLSPQTTVERAQPAGHGVDPCGVFMMGSNHHYREEAPAHLATVDGFWLDRWPVTNEQFRRFVEETGYVTQAEIAPIAARCPGADPPCWSPRRSSS